MENPTLRAMLDAIAGKKGTGTSNANTSSAYNSTFDVVSGLKPASHVVKG
jgi:hypothetical protein